MDVKENPLFFLASSSDTKLSYYGVCVQDPLTALNDSLGEVTIVDRKNRGGEHFVFFSDKEGHSGLFKHDEQRVTGFKYFIRAFQLKEDAVLDKLGQPDQLGSGGDMFETAHWHKEVNDNIYVYKALNLRLKQDGLSRIFYSVHIGTYKELEDE